LAPGAVMGLTPTTGKPPEVVRMPELLRVKVPSRV